LTVLAISRRTLQALFNARRLSSRRPTPRRKRSRTPLIDAQRQSNRHDEHQSALAKTAANDNHHPALPPVLIQIDARFSSRLSRYTSTTSARKAAFGPGSRGGDFDTML
jgi:hypothetical protein